jgi:hypothetical protein
MTGADAVFADVKASYDPNQAIYGVGNNDDELLAMFETEDAINEENNIADLDDNQKNKNKDGLK